MAGIEKFFPIHNKPLYYPSVSLQLETIDRLIEQIPQTAGFHYSIHHQLKKAISPLQKDVCAFFLQEEGVSEAQLITKTRALYAQQAWIMRDKAISKALNDTLQAIQQGLPKTRKGLRCFISYAWPTAEHQQKEYWLQPFLRTLHGHLIQAGIKPQLDIINNTAGGNIVTFANQIKNHEFSLLICTESLLDKHNDPRFKVVQMELSLLRQKYDIDIARGKVRIFPFLVSGSRASATLPEHNLYRTVRDWRVQSYIKNLEQLIGWICYPQGDDAYRKIWQDFYAKYPPLASSMPDDHVKQELALHWHQREIDNLQKEGFYAGLLSQQHQPTSPTPSGVKETKGTAPSHTHTIISYDMPRPVEGFIGRVELLNTLATQFSAPDPSEERETKETKKSKKSTSSSTPSPRKLVLCTGLGGVGKTQLALRYADTAKKAYAHKFWFVADTPDALNASYRLFAKEKGLMGDGYVPDKEVIKAVNQWLASQPNWLIIYDNVERYEDVVSYLPTQGAGDILLTSRLAPIKWPKSVTAIAVDVLSIDEANQLIASLIDTPDDVDIPKLATLLGFLPLALVQASAYIRNKSISVADYLKLYEERAKYLLEQPDMPVGFPAHDPVFITWDINLDAIAKEEKAKGKTVQAKQLLQFCAFLSPQKIPSRVIETWHKGTYPHTQEPFQEARERLHTYSLIQLHREDHSMQVHRLVQQVMRERLTSDEQHIQITQVIQWLTVANPKKGGNQVADQAWRMFLPHLEAVIGYHKQNHCADDPDLATALDQLGTIYASLLGQPAKSCVLYERALAIQEAHYGREHYRVTLTLNNLGIAYGSLGQIGKERDLLERTLAIQQEAHCGKDHYEVARTLANLGGSYNNLGQTSKARGLLERALAIQEAHYGKDHYHVATALNNLGNVYGNLGQISKERDLLERALAIQEAHYGKDHYHVATALNNLGNVYGNLGQISKERDLLERALAIDEAHYGKDHYHVATALNNLGNAYGNLGQVGKQRELLERALAIKEAHYGKDHYEVAMTLVNLGTAYSDLGQVGKQRDLLERALAIKEAYYGKDHYEVAMTLVNLGTAYGNLGQIGKKQGLLERALAIEEAHYGKDHYQVAMTLMNLANAYYAQEVNKAQKLLERALAIFEAHYGKEHYQVAMTLTNLGNAYERLGQVGKKRELLERALAIFEAHYGSMHPELAVTLTHLAMVYHKLQQPQVALQAAQRAYRALVIHPDYGAKHPKTIHLLRDLQATCGFTEIMLQSGDTIAEEKSSIQSSLPITSPPPQESQVADKTSASAFPIGSNARQCDGTIEFRFSYGLTVYRYFSDLAEMIGNGHQGKPLITVQDATPSASTSFTISLSTLWLKQLYKGNREGFREICYQLNASEKMLLTKIGLADVDNRERKENKAGGTTSVPVTQSHVSPPLSSAASSIGFVSSSTSTLTAPPNNLSSSLTSSSSSSFFSTADHPTSNTSPLSTSDQPKPSANSMQSIPAEAKNNHRSQADTLLDDVYDLLDQAYPPRDVAHADMRKAYLLQLSEFQRRKGHLTTADYIALEQLQATLQEQGRTLSK